MDPGRESVYTFGVVGDGMWGFEGGGGGGSTFLNESQVFNMEVLVI